VNLSSTIFDRSAPDLGSCPDESLPEFAFIGRSNVGKSSLLNMLTGQKNLARVSPTPGFTKLINFFTVSKCWRLVDLPGYGFAQVARKDKARFNAAVGDFLEHRPNLLGLFVLIDSRLPPQKIDLEFLEWLACISAPIVLVFTKTDKVSPTKLRANIEAFTARLSEWYPVLPEIFTSSSVTRQGRNELLGVIETALSACRAEEPAKSDQPPLDAAIPPEDPPAIARKVIAGDARARRPNPARPW